MRGFGILAGVLGLALSGPVLAGDVFMGKTLYERHCASCHGADGAGVMPGMPNFTHGDRLIINSNDKLRESIRQGIGVMPGFAAILNEQEIQDLIAYMRTLM